MILSGIVSIIGLSLLDIRFNSYVKGAQKANNAAKESIIDISSAARNIREMALNDDSSNYENYKNNVKTVLTDSQTQLDIIKNTNIIDDDLYNQYVKALNEWGSIGYDIINQIEKGDLASAKNKIHTVCTPALNNLMSIADKMEDETNKEANQAILSSNVAAINAKNKNGTEKKEIKEIQKKEYEQYRNTERGKYDKNSKGIYYSNGNYEAFARPRKPEGVDQKSAYLVGAGLASLAAACFLVRDGQMKGENIHILEEQKLPGGACDGINDPQKGFIIRGGREMENHFECLWDLFRCM